MDTLVRTLGRTPRTIQYHLHLLKDLGLVEFVGRQRAKRGRFMSWVYWLIHLAAVAERIRERREKNRIAYRKRKRSRRRSESRDESSGSQKSILPIILFLWSLPILWAN
jgi:DNA-binding transcriptional ArsR family regulator